MFSPSRSAEDLFLSPTCFPFSSLCCVCSIVLWSLTRIQSGSGGAVNNFTHSLYSPLVWNMLVLKWLCSIFRRTAHLGTFDNSMRVESNSGLQQVATQTYPRCGTTTELPICETSINFLPNHSAIGIAWYSTSGTVTVSNTIQRLKDLWGFSANRSLQSQRSLFESPLRGNVFIVRLVGGKTILQVPCKWLLELNVQATICRSPISR